MEKLKQLIAENKTIAIVIGGILAIVMLGKFLKPKPRRRNTRVSVVNKPRRRVSKVTRPRKKTVSKGKKPWQVKGSLAAKRYMARLRRMK